MEALLQTVAALPASFYFGMLGWAAFGIFIGILSSMLGVGGGTVMVPVFRLVGGFEAVVCSATSLFVIVPTGISGMLAHLKAGTCRIPVGLAAGIAGACTSVLGARLGDVAPGWSIILVAALVVIYSGYNMLKKALKAPTKAQREANAKAKAQAAAEAAAFGATAGATVAAPAAASAALTAAAEPAALRREVLIAAAIGLFAGIVGGFVGVGGGFIMVPLFCSILGMDMKHAAGTSLFAIFILAIPAVVTQFIQGNVLWSVGLMVVLGTLPGTVIGQKLAARMADRTLRFIFAGLLFFAAIMMVVQEIGLLG